jgi:hypothetical protein
VAVDTGGIPIASVKASTCGSDRDRIRGLTGITGADRYTIEEMLCLLCELRFELELKGLLQRQVFPEKDLNFS